MPLHTGMSRDPNELGLCSGCIVKWVQEKKGTSVQMKGFSLSQTWLYIPSIQEAEAGPLFMVNLGYIPGVKFKKK